MASWHQSFFECINSVCELASIKYKLTGRWEEIFFPSWYWLNFMYLSECCFLSWSVFLMNEDQTDIIKGACPRQNCKHAKAPGHQAPLRPLPQP